MHLDAAEAGLGEIFLRRPLASHGAEPIAALVERHGYAVQTRHGVEQRPGRMVAVLVDVARAVDVLRDVDASQGERTAHAGEDRARSRLVVDGMEGGDEVERFPLRRAVEAAVPPRCPNTRLTQPSKQAFAPTPRASIISLHKQAAPNKKFNRTRQRRRTIGGVATRPAPTGRRSRESRTTQSQPRPPFRKTSKPTKRRSGT